MLEITSAEVEKYTREINKIYTMYGSDKWKINSGRCTESVGACSFLQDKSGKRSPHQNGDIQITPKRRSACQVGHSEIWWLF